MDPATMAAIGQAAPAVIGGIGGLMGGSGGDKHMSLKDVYGKHLVGDIKDMQQQMLGLDAPQYFQGDTVADMDPAERQALLTGINYGDQGGFGYLTRQNQLQQGNMGLGAMGGAADYMNQMQTGNATAGLDMAMNNPYLQGMVGAVQQPWMDQLNETALPGQAAAGFMGGMTPSSTQGVENALLRNKAATGASNATSSLLGNTYGQGLGYQTAMNNQMLSGFNNMMQQGLPGFGNALTTDLTSLKLKEAGGNAFQQQNQANIDANKARWDFEQGAPANWLNSQMTFLKGTTPAGIGQNITQTAGPSWMEKMLTGAQAGQGIYDAISPIFNTGGDSFDVNNYSTDDLTMGNF